MFKSFWNKIQILGLLDVSWVYFVITSNLLCTDHHAGTGVTKDCFLNKVFIDLWREEDNDAMYGLRETLQGSVSYFCNINILFNIWESVKYLLSNGDQIFLI